MLTAKRQIAARAPFSALGWHRQGARVPAVRPDMVSQPTQLHFRIRHASRLPHPRLNLTSKTTCNCLPSSFSLHQSQAKQSKGRRPTHAETEKYLESYICPSQHSFPSCFSASASLQLGRQLRSSADTSFYPSSPNALPQWCRNIHLSPTGQTRLGEHFDISFKHHWAIA